MKQNKASIHGKWLTYPHRLTRLPRISPPNEPFQTIASPTRPCPPSLPASHRSSLDVGTARLVAGAELLQVELSGRLLRVRHPARLDVLEEALLAAVPAVARLAVASEPSGRVEHVVTVDPHRARLEDG